MPVKPLWQPLPLRHTAFVTLMIWGLTTICVLISFCVLFAALMIARGQMLEGKMLTTIEAVIGRLEGSFDSWAL